MAPHASVATGVGKTSPRGRKEEACAAQSSETSLGQVIRAWRHVRGMSVTDLAVAAGFGHNGRGYISKIEHQHIRRLGEDRLNRIAAALHLESADLLLRRLPESLEHTSAHELEEALIGAKTLLAACTKQSFDWARMQLLLARLYRERAAASGVLSVQYAALAEAQSCVESALPVFNVHRAEKSIEEAEQLGQEINDVLETLILPGCLALLKRCVSGSLDWARVQALRAKFFYERALVLPDQAARTALFEAQRCVEAALSVFTQKGAQRSAREAQQLSQEVKLVFTQLGGGESMS